LHDQREYVEALQDARVEAVLLQSFLYSVVRCVGRQVKLLLKELVVDILHSPDYYAEVAQRLRNAS
jgi:hypothetical protein